MVTLAGLKVRLVTYSSPKFTLTTLPVEGLTPPLLLEFCNIQVPLTSNCRIGG